MCTEGLLSKLRCAECCHIKFQHFFDWTFRVSLVALGAISGWLLARNFK
jgi:hypothetical protein